MRYDVLLLSLAIDLVAISTLTYGIYFHRHHRRDLTLGFIGVNVGLFAVASFVSTRPVGLAFGIGLFALLSVIRLRSTQVTQEEIGYYFVAIVIGLVNGWSPDEHWGTTLTLTVVLVAVMFVADHPRVLRGYERRIVRLKAVFRDDAELRRTLEHKLGGRVVNVTVLEVDLVQKQTRVDVRFRPDPPGTHPSPPREKARAEAPSPTAADVLLPVAFDRENPDEAAASPGETNAPVSATSEPEIDADEVQIETESEPNAP